MSWVRAGRTVITEDSAVDAVLETALGASVAAASDTPELYDRVRLACVTHETADLVFNYYAP